MTRRIQTKEQAVAFVAYVVQRPHNLRTPSLFSIAMDVSSHFDVRAIDVLRFCKAKQMRKNDLQVVK